jgi:hypothetical protein
VAGAAVERAASLGWPVGLGFIDALGVERRVGLGSCAGVRFEDARPVRAFRWSRGLGHFPGWWWAATTGCHIGHESWLERDIPVVYITVPPAATPKMIAMEFARFFDLPISRRGNITDIADAVCGVSLDAHVTLVAVDELHNLNTATRRAGAEASDTLKYFSERVPATFCYAGISLERTGLLSGTRGEQIAGRFGMVRTGAFGQDPQWTALIAALEHSLRLHRHRPGTLTKLDRYLHQRTHGMIGSLLWLIRSAAINAVLDGTEKITKQSLDAVEADITAQSPRQPNR